MKKIKKIPFIIAISSISLAVASSAFGITYAAYWSKKSIVQTTGYRGPLSVFPIYLDTNGNGNDGWEKDDAVFYLYAFNSSNPSTFKWIEATKINSAPIYDSTRTSVSHTYAPLYWFRFDSAAYNRFNFVRFNPDGATIPSWNREDNPRSLWDQTSAQSYNSSYNLYHIDSANRINNGDGFGHDTASCSNNNHKIAEDISNSKLYFMA